MPRFKRLTRTHPQGQPVLVNLDHVALIEPYHANNWTRLLTLAPSKGETVEVLVQEPMDQILSVGDTVS